MHKSNKIKDIKSREILREETEDGISKKIITVNFSEGVYEVINYLSKKNNVSMSEYVEVVVVNHINYGHEIIDWAEEVKHKRNMDDTYISKKGKRKQLTFKLDVNGYTLIKKFGMCRRMSVNDWIEDHFDAAFLGIIDPTRKP